MLHGPVTRYTLPTLNGINLVMDDALGGGVTILESRQPWQIMELHDSIVDGRGERPVARRLGQPTSPEAGP
ncbi:MAG: hypothetical protein Ct9H300mP16_00190 [Pseudomonadota bacterium]|nr:MAG: hypothetical protein Ct9H300mP16_00190 [Pseudomonadota bacterium]